MSKHENIKNKVSDIDAMSASNWSSINPEYVARMRMQNRFKTD
jgi:isocitrate lyase